VVSGFRLCNVTLTETDPDPEPSSNVGVLDDSATADVPYSKWSVVSRAPGLTDPVSVAVVEPIADACPVVAAADAWPVVNSWRFPSVVPDEFVATNAK
jgi:hypothetical protein